MQCAQLDRRPAPPVVEDDADPLGVMHLVTHTGSLDEAPALYEEFQKKQDGCIKVVLKP